MAKLFPIAFAVGLLLGCGGHYKPTQPVELAPEACCTIGDMELQHFQGCRVGGRRCKKGEIYWMQGSVTCGPVDEANCAGGRCCHYKPRYRPGLGTPEDTAGDESAAPPDEAGDDEAGDDDAGDADDDAGDADDDAPDDADADPDAE
jgi:hypothetical protein